MSPGSVAVTLLLAIGVGFGQSDLPRDLTLLRQIKQRMVPNLSQIPNYTCLQTTERSRRWSSSEKFKVVDTVRLEVALVGGKELFSWPGAGRFEEKPIGELVGSGTTSSGDYALHARTVFSSRAPTFAYRGEETVDGRRTIRFDYRIGVLESGYRLLIGSRSAVAPYGGSFWADRDTLDLVRLDVVVDEAPADLGVALASTQISYGKVKVGESQFLLPSRVELVLRLVSGLESRNRTDFTGCRQYVGESTISFDEPSSEQPAASEKQVAYIELPTGISVESRLASSIDPKKAVVGDPITAVVLWPVKVQGKVVVPKGAVLTGRIRRLETVTGAVERFVVALEFFKIEFEGKEGRFYAQLEQVGPIPGVSARQMATLLIEKKPGIGTFLIQGMRVRLPKGLRLVWTTAQLSQP